MSIKDCELMKLLAIGLWDPDVAFVRKVDFVGDWIGDSSFVIHFSEFQMM